MRANRRHIAFGSSAGGVGRLGSIAGSPLLDPRARRSVRRLESRVHPLVGGGCGDRGRSCGDELAHRRGRDSHSGPDVWLGARLHRLRQSFPLQQRHASAVHHHGRARLDRSDRCVGRPPPRTSTTGSRAPGSEPCRTTGSAWARSRVTTGSPDLTRVSAEQSRSQYRQWRTSAVRARPRSTLARIMLS